MKKASLFMICILTTIVCSGCGQQSSSDSRSANQTAGVSDVLEAGMEKADAEAASEENAQQTSEASVSVQADSAAEQTENAEDPGQAEETARQSGVNEAAPSPEPVSQTELAKTGTLGIDVDLTALSSTMVYSEVYNMMVHPEDYIGKTIKMRGEYASYHDEVSGSNYYACIIQDATACCAQGIEFDLTDDYTVPDDLPEVGDNLTVVGSFDTYSEGEYMYCTLRNAELV